MYSRVHVHIQTEESVSFKFNVHIRPCTTTRPHISLREASATLNIATCDCTCKKADINHKDAEDSVLQYVLWHVLLLAQQAQPETIL